MVTVYIVLLIIAAAGGVWWNHHNSAAAMAGVSFVLPYPPTAVAAAIDRAHGQGAKAALQGMVSGVAIVPLGRGSFATNSRVGDSGEISLAPDPAGTLVHARALSLWLGMPQRQLDSANGGIWGLSVAISHGITRALGIAPGAAKLRRWQNGLEGRITKTLTRD